MKTRSRLFSNNLHLLILFVSIFLSSCKSVNDSQPEESSSTSPPNIILIMADDIGIEGLGSYGGLSYKTPRLDRLADQGIRFTHAYSQPLCTNTRIQLMTGLHNNKNWKAFGILDPKAKTIGHYLSEAGYKSCIAGKWQLQSYDPPDYPGSEKRRGTGMHPKDAGFDSYSLFHSLHTEDKGSRYADPTYLENGKLIDNVKGKYGPDLWVDHINDFMEKNQKDPFFVYYPMALPHWPMVPSPLSAEWKDPSLRNHEDTRHFKSMVEYMDFLVGRIEDKVEALGLTENTVILFYSDNGTHLKITSQTQNGPIKGGKGLTTDAGTRVPLIVKWPQKIKPGVSDALVDSTDFIPTLLDLAQKPLAAEHKLDGKSFHSTLLGSKDHQREWVYCFYDPRPGWDKDQFTELVFVRDRRYKLYDDGRLYDIQNDVLEENAILPSQDTGSTRQVRSKLYALLRENEVK